MQTKQSPARILIVDDEAALARSLERLLTKAGFFVLLAPSGEEALATLRTTTVDLCITDIAMRGMSGIEFLRAIRADERIRDLPVIVQSAFALETQKETIALKPLAVFQKPVKMDDLLWAVRDALESDAK